MPPQWTHFRNGGKRSGKKSKNGRRWTKKWQANKTDPAVTAWSRSGTIHWVLIRTSCQEQSTQNEDKIVSHNSNGFLNRLFRKIRTWFHGNIYDCFNHDDLDTDRQSSSLICRRWWWPSTTSDFLYLLTVCLFTNLLTILRSIYISFLVGCSLLPFLSLPSISSVSNSPSRLFSLWGADVA